MQTSCDHRLLDVLAIAILAITCRADNWTDLETFGERRHDWLKTFLDLPNGMPSHDMFQQMFGLRAQPIVSSCGKKSFGGKSQLTAEKV